jgi:hypothetical protein
MSYCSGASLTAGPANSAVDRTAGSHSLAAAGHRERYPVVRVCLASLSAHGESAPGQFMMGLR